LNDFTELVDLAAARLGGAVLYANDEFFAPKENLLKAAAPVFLADEYTERGKWMDGWETRRRRTPGYDWCLVRLGLPGVVRGVVVDTSYFRGNYPEQCALEACAVAGQPDVEQLLSAATTWTEILPPTQLKGDTHNPFAVQTDMRVTHLRLKIYPDGGVARLRVYGEVVPDWARIEQSGSLIDLASVEHGGLVLACSDMFFGHRHNLIMPGRGINMSDGWETKRRRGPGHDWVVIRLGRRGRIEQVEVDTAYFKGNYPESCSLEACVMPDWPIEGDPFSACAWTELLPRTKLQAHTRHLFADELQAVGAVTHVRFNIYPDGGVSRLRLYGRLNGKAADGHV
jgi:allantoicase